MKVHLILLLIFFVAAPGKAEPLKLEFRCVNSMPTSSFLLRTEGRELVLTTIHHNGTPYMPIHEGIVVPNDIPYLKSVAEHLIKMGDRNEFRFPLENCKVYGHGLMSCAGGEKKNFGGEEMEALNLYTSKITEEAFGQKFERYKVTLSVNISGFVPVQDIMNEFYGSECSFSF